MNKQDFKTLILGILAVVVVSALLSFIIMSGCEKSKNPEICKQRSANNINAAPIGIAVGTSLSRPTYRPTNR